jgi:hypothetical protein
VSCGRHATRDERLRHTKDCSACRAQLFGGQPEQLFSLLALDAPPTAALEQLTSGVMQRIEGESAIRRRRLRLRALIPVAASVLLAAFFGIYATLQNMQAPSGMAALVPFLEASAPSDGIELISSPGEAQVMEFTVGETQVVMIFDEAMNI